MKAASPLRYPGGKWRFAPFLSRSISLNELQHVQYLEPYAGGASLALSLLFEDAVEHIHLNDLDPAVHAFWWAVLNRTAQFIDRINSAPLTSEEWHRQREVYRRNGSGSKFALAFAFLYLNRTNHSGIINGGMIGGKQQNGHWRLDARFNRDRLTRQILLVADYRRRITLTASDALDFLRSHRRTPNTFAYLDPPYYLKGSSLYMNSYCDADHRDVARFMAGWRGPWMVSYDDAPPIRALYKRWRSRRVTLHHSARQTRVGQEILFASDSLRLPRQSPALIRRQHALVER